MKWVRLAKYCEMSGDTEDAVHARRRAGIWLDEVHVRMAGDGKIWINLERVNEWIETSTKALKSGTVNGAAPSASASPTVAPSVGRP